MDQTSPVPPLPSSLSGRAIPEQIADPAARKAALRAQLRQRRRARRGADGNHTAQQRQDAAQEAQSFADSIHQGCLQLDPGGSAEEICLFLPMRSEPDVRSALQRSHDSGLRVLVPRVTGPRQMEWVQWTPQSRSVDSLISGLSEPEGPAVMPSREALLFLPALALGAGGVRLGQGGGFYDSFLASPLAPVRRAAVLFRSELLETPVPAEPWDARIPLAATEQGLWIWSEKMWAEESGNPSRRREGLERGYPHTGCWELLS